MQQDINSCNNLPRNSLLPCRLSNSGMQVSFSDPGNPNRGFVEKCHELSWGEDHVKMTILACEFTEVEGSLKMS